MTRTKQDRNGINRSGRHLTGEGKIGKDRKKKGQERAELIPQSLQLQGQVTLG
jgi:hypothetical protein